MLAHHRNNEMLSELPSKTSSHPIAKSEPIRIQRSNTVGVQVVRNKTGWHVNVSIDKTPYNHYGPFSEAITLTEAMVYVASLLNLEGEI
jgi:hypothetical protein